MARDSAQAEAITALGDAMLAPTVPKRMAIMEAIFETLKLTRHESSPALAALIAWRNAQRAEYQALYSSELVDESANSPVYTPYVAPVYGDDAPLLNGYEILNRYFDGMFARDPRIITFGEDVGFLGGVNQTMAGMQAKYGALRVADTGIREATILGQAIGAALRGLRPIAEIQYLDYMLYALQTMSDDLATLRWRTVGGQIAPAIIRTRGHRLEGVWHAGSPMGGILHLVRGVHVLVPRDMTRAVGFYNTLLGSNDPGLVVEVLNGYRPERAFAREPRRADDPAGGPRGFARGLGCDAGDLRRDVRDCA